MKMPQIKKFFDEFSSHYDECAFFSSIGTSYLSEIETSFVLSSCPIVKNARVLDIGIGTGRCSSLLANKGAEIHGIDISGKMIEKAKLRLGKSLIDFQIKNVQEGIPHPANSFDIILCIRALKYMPRWRFVIKEINRTLKSNGLLILEISNRLSIASLGTKNANYFLFDLKELIGILKDEGFSVKSLKGGTKLPFILYEKVHSGWLLFILKNVEKILHIFLSFHFSRNILIAAQKEK
jgi:ubiquinone/menaquinone biosynthesis C-methylase UbiE